MSYEDSEVSGHFLHRSLHAGVDLQEEDTISIIHWSLEHNEKDCFMDICCIFYVAPHYCYDRVGEGFQCNVWLNI